MRLLKISVLGLQLFSHNIIFYCCMLEELSKADPEYSFIICKLSVHKNIATFLKGTIGLSKGSIVLYWLNVTMHSSWQHLLIVAISNSHARELPNCQPIEQAPHTAELGLT